MTSTEHARLLGLLFWIYAGFQLVVGAFAGIMVVTMSGVIGTAIAKMPHRAGEPDPEVFFTMLPLIMVFVMIIALLMIIPKLVAGYGLRTGKSWAKIWAIIACCLAVLNIPFGLALGIYGFWFIFGDAGRDYFDNPTQSSQMPPPRPNSWR